MEIIMAGGAFDPNKFPEFATSMNEDAKKAIAASFDAMSNWRSEIATASEKYGNAVFDKMKDAAKQMGWPTDMIDMSREQMQQASRMQIQLMDQVMDAWEQQLKSPGAAFKMPTFPGANMFQGMPTGFPGAGGFPGMPGMPGMPQMDMSKLPPPMQFWMQAAEMWQKSWQQAMTQWMETQQKMMGPDGSSKGRR
ncbi:MAG: hypothetical protein NW216_01525 [Hyphomicrobium sp.]|nr:hypothetical protein [Hyphomicrobium sp.]